MSIYPSKVKAEASFQPQSARLMDQACDVLRYHHYGRKTELAYVRWIKGFIYFYYFVQNNE